MKVTKHETLYHEDFEAQVWKKDSSIAPFYLFSFLGLLFFLGLSFLFFWGQCSIKWWSSHFYLFTTQWLQLGSKTKYDSIWMPPAVYRDMQWIKSDKYENYERWLCHKYYVNYMIMLSNMTMMDVSWWTRWWKVAWQYISEWLWKCHNR